MNIESLVIVYGLVLMAMVISYSNQLKLEKDLMMGSTRALVQLILMGFILEAIFKIEGKVFLFLILLLMCGVAASISGKRGKEIPQSYQVAFIGILAGSVLTFSILFVAGIIAPEAKFIIPLGGMIIGNSMNASSLAMNRLIGEMKHQSSQIETLLALGANKGQASQRALRKSVRAALIPSIDSMKVIGLVHLPGIMTGFIIAGGSPLEAVKYQLAVVFMIAGTASLTTILTTHLATRKCFTENLQLIDRFKSSPG